MAILRKRCRLPGERIGPPIQNLSFFRHQIDRTTPALFERAAQLSDFFSVRDGIGGPDRLLRVRGRADLGDEIKLVVRRQRRPSAIAHRNDLAGQGEVHRKLLNRSDVVRCLPAIDDRKALQQQFPPHNPIALADNRQPIVEIPKIRGRMGHRAQHGVVHARQMDIIAQVLRKQSAVCLLLPHFPERSGHDIDKSRLAPPIVIRAHIPHAIQQQLPIRK